MVDGEEQENLPDGVAMVQGENDEEESTELDESYSAAIEQSILQQAMESDQQQAAVVGVVGNGE